MKTLIAILGLCVMTVASFAADNAYSFKTTSIDGKPVDLAAYKGKVALFVNVASKCGYTPQYEGLEALYRKYKDKGLVVLGFPANDFGMQEPDTNEVIADFCKRTYDVTFPMFAKVSVKGDGQIPLYRYLTSNAGEVRWNFTKFLVGKDGNVISRFDSKVKPDDPELVRAIETALR
jgi:glutathione peroxidase